MRAGEKASLLAMMRDKRGLAGHELSTEIRKMDGFPEPPPISLDFIGKMEKSWSESLPHPQPVEPRGIHAKNHGNQ
jgi:hypothetical protein